MPTKPASELEKLLTYGLGATDEQLENAIDVLRSIQKSRKPAGKSAAKPTTKKPVKGATKRPAAGGGANGAADSGSSPDTAN